MATRSATQLQFELRTKITPSLVWFFFPPPCPLPCFATSASLKPHSMQSSLGFDFDADAEAEEKLLAPLPESLNQSRERFHGSVFCFYVPCFLLGQVDGFMLPHAAGYANTASDSATASQQQQHRARASLPQTPNSHGGTQTKSLTLLCS